MNKMHEKGKRMENGRKRKQQIDYNVCTDTHVRSNKKSMYDMVKQMGCMSKKKKNRKKQPHIHTYVVHKVLEQRQKFVRKCWEIDFFSFRSFRCF